MIPLTDDNPVHRTPWLTVALMVACVVVFFVVQPNGRDEWRTPGLQRIAEGQLEFVLGQAAVPCEVVKGRPLTESEVEATFGEANDDSACGIGPAGAPSHVPGKHVYLAVLVSMFLHGNLPHLFGNLLFLWVFGNNVEDRWGWWRYLLLYLAAGLAAAAAHIAVDPASTVPIVGASGAIAGVMGAYLVWFPRARIKCLVFGLLFRKVAAAWVLGLWLAEQFLLVGSDSGIAWSAHVGGFAFGVAAGLAGRRYGPKARRGSAGPVGMASAATLGYGPTWAGGPGQGGRLPVP